MAITRVCDTCHRAMNVHVGEAVVDGTAVWHLSSTCGGCRSALEEDGLAPAPEEIRDELLALHGCWRVDVPQPLSVPQQMALREAMRWSLDEMRAFRSGDLAALVTGTRGEMQALAFQLQQAGIAAQTVSGTDMAAEN